MGNFNIITSAIDAHLKGMLWAIFICVFSIAAHSQESKGVLSYEVKVIQRYTPEKKLSDKLKVTTTREDSLRLEGAIENLRKFTTKHKSDDSDTITDNYVFHFNKSKARVLGKPSFGSETFELYEFDACRQIYWRFHKGNIADLRIDTMFYAEVGYDNKYAIDVQREVRKKINGFDCYLVKVVVSNNRKWEDNKQHYEIYVTDDVAFPPSALFDWSENMISACPVFATGWFNDDRNNYTEYELKTFNNRLRRRMLKLPRKFRN